MESILREFKTGWPLVVGRFISGFVEVGTVKSFGVILPEMVTQLQATSGVIGMAFGLCHGLTFGLGPLTSALYRYTQSRLVMVFGTLLAVVSLCLASLAYSAAQLIVALIFAGLGYSLMCIPTLMALNKHFIQRFALAYGIAQTGPAVGMIVLPVITEHFNERFGWKGALLLLAAVNSHMMITAVVTREPEEPGARRKSRKPADDVENSDDKLGNKASHDCVANTLKYDQRQSRDMFASCVNLSFSRSKANAKRSFLMRRFKSCDDEMVRILSQDELALKSSDYQTLGCRVRNEDSAKSVGNTPNASQGYEHDTEQALNQSHIPHSYSSSNGKGESEKSYGVEQNAGDNRRLSSVSEGDRKESLEQRGSCGALSSGCSIFWKAFTSGFATLIRFLDFKLLSDYPAMVFLMLSFVLLTSVHVSWMIFLVPHAVAKGISLKKAVFLSSVGGTGNLIGRIIQGPLVDRGVLTGVQLSILLSIVNILSFVLDPLLESLPVLCTDAFFSGLCSGALIPLVAICVKEIVPRDRFASAVGISSLSYGIGEPLGGYVSGKLSDVTSSYDVVFLVFGGMEMAKTLLLVVVALMVWRQTRTSIDR